MSRALPQEIKRTPFKSVTVDVGTTVGASTPIDISEVSALRFRRLTGTFTTVAVHESDSLNGTYTAMEDSTGAAITMASLTGNTRVVIPEVFAANFIKFVAASNAGTATIGGKC